MILFCTSGRTTRNSLITVRTSSREKRRLWISCIREVVSFLYEPFYKSLPPIVCPFWNPELKAGFIKAGTIGNRLFDQLDSFFAV